MIFSNDMRLLNLSKLKLCFTFSNRKNILPKKERNKNKRSNKSI